MKTLRQKVEGFKVDSRTLGQMVAEGALARMGFDYRYFRVLSRERKKQNIQYINKKTPIFTPA